MIVQRGAGWYNVVLVVQVMLDGANLFDVRGYLTHCLRGNSTARNSIERISSCYYY